MVEMKVFKDKAEWLKHRKKYIGGSDCAAIVGQNPWKNNVELWLEKTGQVIAPDISDNPNVRFGIDAEPIIRELFKLNYPEYEVYYVENNSWVNDKYPFAAVSHDAWLVEKETGRKGIWECKTTEIVSSMQKEKWSGQVPQNYYCQLLHSLLVREDCDFAHLTALLTWKFNEEEVYQQIRNYHLERSEVEEDIKYLESSERRFWEQVQSKTRPALLLPEI